MAWTSITGLKGTELRDELAAAGLPMPENIITPEECAKAIYDLLK